MKVGKLWLYAFVLRLLYSAVLRLFAEPTLLYLGNLVLHMLLGLRSRRLPSSTCSDVSNPCRSPCAWGLILFLLSALPAMVLMKVGGMRPNRWLLHMHIAMAIPAAILLAAVFRAFARRVSFGLDRGASQLAWRSYLVVLPMLVVFPVGVKTYQHYFPSPWTAFGIRSRRQPRCSKKARAKTAHPFPRQPIRLAARPFLRTFS